MKNLTLYILGSILGVFGLLTLFLSGSIIFDLFEMRAKQGNYVISVIWANFVASLLYLGAAYGFFTKKKWTKILLGFAVFALVLGVIGLLIHINLGGIYMQKTVKAIGFRIGITLIFLGFAYLKCSRRTLEKNT